MIAQPYYRIIRPLGHISNYTVGNTDESNYMLDERYAEDRNELIRAYHILEKDLIELFEFVDPADNNLPTFSHRIYELFLRACTEFETNATKILEVNGYNRNGKWNILDYYLVNSATRLNEYRLFINIWKNGKKEIRPLEQWNVGHTLSWYQDYNTVKHDRNREFGRANLGNLISATGAVFCILFAQFHNLIFTLNQPTIMYSNDENTGELSSGNMLFGIILPTSWQRNEMYRFDWPTLRTQEAPIQKFQFQV